MCILHVRDMLCTVCTGFTYAYNRVLHKYMYVLYVELHVSVHIYMYFIVHVHVCRKILFIESCCALYHELYLHVYYVVCTSMS